MVTVQPVPSSVPVATADLQLRLVVDGVEDFDDDYGSGSRRPSSSSLSRFRSCPQLASLVNTSQDSPCSDMAPITDMEGNIMHTIPMSRNNLFVDTPAVEIGGIRSAVSTPTPPSTPGSRRRDQMASSLYPNSQAPSNESSQPHAFKVLRQSTTDHISGDMGFSTDSQEGIMDDWMTIQNEGPQHCQEYYDRGTSRPANFPFDDYHDQTLDDERVSETDGASSMHLTSRFSSRVDRPLHCEYFNSGFGNDSVDKCNRWLQSLQLTKSDKVKSRSHIQLAPV